MPLSTIGSNQITDGAIAVADVADGSITTAKIADDAVTSAKVDTNIAIGGTLNVSGAFTSQGIDDNADAVALEITSSEDVVIKHGTNNAKLVFNDQSNSSNIFIQQIGSSGSPALRFFESTGDERMRLHNGGILSVNQGIALGVGSNNTSSNVLGDYEEGTFTPTAGDGNTTYNTQHGFYTKIGEMVHAQFNIAINSFGGSTRFAMGGLPFTSKNTSGSSGIGTITYFNSIHTSAVMLSARNDANTSAVYISGTTGNGGTMANINHNVFQNGTNVFGAVIYRAS